MGFRIGQKVQCVVKTPWFFRTKDNPVAGPSYGEVVQIAHIDLTDGYLSLVEYRALGYYKPTGFRPLVSTDISIFHSILANPHKELETA